MLQGLSTLTDVNANYSQPCVNSANCSPNSFIVVLSSFLSWVWKSVLGQRFQGGLSINITAECVPLSLFLLLSVQHPSLWFSVSQILAILTSWISHLSLFSPVRPLSSVWVPCPCDASWKLLQAISWHNLRAHFVSFFLDHRPVSSVNQCPKDIALCILSSFLVFWGRRVPVSPVFKWKSLTSFLGTLHIDCRFLSLKKLCHFRHGFWIVKKICI